MKQFLSGSVFWWGMSFLGILASVGVFFLWNPPQAFIGTVPNASLFVKHPPFLTDISLSGFSQAPLKGESFQIVKSLKETPKYTLYQVLYSSNGLKISGVLYWPKERNGKVPLMVSNHGYYALDAYKVGHGLLREEDVWARNGYAVFHSDYRWHGKSDKTRDPREIFDSSLHYAMDVLNGIDALKKSQFASDIDFDRLIMVGHSMGGEIALDIAVTHPGTADAYILYAAAHADGWVNFDRWSEDDPVMTKATLEKMGNKTANPKFWDGLNNLLYLDEITRPIYFFHGGDDSTCPAIWSKVLAADLNKRGKKAHYTVYREEPHEFRNAKAFEFAHAVLKIAEKESK